MAFQLIPKMNREKTLTGQYYDLHREVQKTLYIDEALFDRDMTIMCLDSITEKLEMIEDYESTV